ncbi:MAG TPA: hypothetical protein VK447_19355 [Myxococcaceae bacterium]|nr:hypothetical protein [Myxococcaceae bacterium]
MASFTFDVVQRRWYWHYENSGQFGGTGAPVGYCDANFDQP